VCPGTHTAIAVAPTEVHSDGSVERGPAVTLRTRRVTSSEVAVPTVRDRRERGGVHYSRGCRHRAGSTRRRLQDDERILSVQRSDIVGKPDHRVWPGRHTNRTVSSSSTEEVPRGLAGKRPNTFRVSAMLNWQIGGLTIRNHTYGCTVEDNMPPSIAVQHALPGRGT